LPENHIKLQQAVMATKKNLNTKETMSADRHVTTHAIL
jgi:hypothetical protein